jgi:hypothetical protein
MVFFVGIPLSSDCEGIGGISVGKPADGNGVAADGAAADFAAVSGAVTVLLALKVSAKADLIFSGAASVASDAPGPSSLMSLDEESSPGAVVTSPAALSGGAGTGVLSTLVSTPLALATVSVRLCEPVKT